MTLEAIGNSKLKWHSTSRVDSAKLVSQWKLTLGQLQISARVADPPKARKGSCRRIALSKIAITRQGLIYYVYL